MDRCNICHPLTFDSVKGRFRMVDATYVPYTDGTGFFAVSRPDRPQPVPFAPSLRCFVGRHPDNELIPVQVIENWMVRLGMTDQEIATFWAVEDLQYGATQRSIEF
jgi:hypothetical protein